MLVNFNKFYLRSQLYFLFFLLFKNKKVTRQDYPPSHQVLFQGELIQDYSASRAHTHTHSATYPLHTHAVCGNPSISALARVPHTHCSLSLLLRCRITTASEQILLIPLILQIPVIRIYLSFTCIYSPSIRKNPISHICHENKFNWKKNSSF